MAGRFAAMRQQQQQRRLPSLPPLLLCLLLAATAHRASAGNCGQTMVAFSSSRPNNLCVPTSSIAVGAHVAVDLPLLFSWCMVEGASTPQGRTR